MTGAIVKQPREVLHPALAVAHPVAVLGCAVASRGLVPAAAPLAAVAAIGDDVVTVTLTGGADGERYLVTVLVRDAAGAEREHELEVAVIDAAWALPDGGAPMLSIAGFVERFGLDEVVRMTDADGSGRVDRALLVQALAAAQALAEAHLAGRYALPLAAVPAVVELAIADLARARLYPRGAPEGVAEAARVATRTLERIAEGRLALGLPAAAQPAAAPTDAPVLIAPGPRAYPDGLADY